MRRVVVVLGVIGLLLILTAPASAGGPGWNLRLYGAGMDPDLDRMVPSENPDEIRVKALSDFGFGASLEYQFNDRLGIELGGMWASPDIELSAEIPDYGLLKLTDSMSTQVTTLDLNFHLTPNSPSFDFYIGAGVANVGFDDLHYVDPEGDPLDIKVDGDVSWSAKAGLDIALGQDSGWAAVGGLRYIDSDIEFRNAEDDAGDTATLSFDMFSFSVGVAYSF